jgi:hypothetical protein
MRVRNFEGRVRRFGEDAIPVSAQATSTGAAIKGDATVEPPFRTEDAACFGGVQA